MLSRYFRWVNLCSLLTIFAFPQSVPYGKSLNVWPDLCYLRSNFWMNSLGFLLQYFVLYNLLYPGLLSSCSPSFCLSFSCSHVFGNCIRYSMQVPKALLHRRDRRKLEIREKEHQDKVNLTKRDIEAGNLESVSRRMKEGEKSLAWHSTTFPHEID